MIAVTGFHKEKQYINKLLNYNVITKAWALNDDLTARTFFAVVHVNFNPPTPNLIKLIKKVSVFFISDLLKKREEVGLN